MAITREETRRRARDGARAADYRFRDMTESDLPAVMSIERNAYEFPWTEGIFKDCIQAGYYCSLLVRGDEIAGYGIMAIAAGEAHVLNICVKRSLQGRGLGRRQLEHLIEKARDGGARRMLLEVRVSNLAAITLYHHLGFVEIGLRRGYYPARHAREDAIVLSKTISPAP
jgi:ribosomal-protein-alanine N-acetyltransferase